MSASRCIGAFDPWASSTKRMMLDNMVSRPTLVARKLKLPVALMVAPYTSLPIPLSTKTLSPVSIDSSTADIPSTTSPSTGIFSPGRTRTTSPATRSSIETSTNSSSRETRAVLGWRPIKALMALEARLFALASKNLPRSTKPMIAVEVSK